MVEILEKYKFDEDEELRRANDTCARTQQRIEAISREEDEVRDIAKAARTLQASTQQIAAKVARRNVDKNTTKLHEKVKININKTLSTITEASTLLNKQMGDVSQTTVDESKMKDGNIQRIEADVSKRKESLDKLDLNEKVHQLKGHLHSRLRSQLQLFKQLQSLHVEESTVSTGITTIGDTMRSLGCGSSPEHSKVSVHIPRAIQGRKREFFITTLDETDCVFDLYREDVKASLRHKETGNTIEAIVEYKVDSKQYCATLTPQHLGEHKLIVTVQNRPVKGSPFHIWVRKWRDWTQLPSSASRFIPPSVMGSSRVYGLAMHTNGNLYVSQHSYIHIIDPKTKVTIAKIGEYGTGARQFVVPEAIAVHGDRIYVADSYNHRVQILCALQDYAFLAQYGTHGSEIGQMKVPSGICLDPCGTMYISDCYNHRITVCESNGTLREIKHPQIMCPWGIAFDPHGNLHIVSNHKSVYPVNVFTPDGCYLKSYGRYRLVEPKAIAIDEEGYSFVVDDDSSVRRLQVFNPQHNLIKTVSGFNYSRGVMIAHDGSLLIGDVNYCIRKC